MERPEKELAPETQDIVFKNMRSDLLYLIDREAEFAYNNLDYDNDYEKLPESEKQLLRTEQLFRLMLAGYESLYGQDSLEYSLERYQGEQNMLKHHWDEHRNEQIPKYNFPLNVP